MKIVMILIMLFLFSALLIISNNNLALQKQENLEKFSELYLKWLDKIFTNIQSITGNAVKMNWVPE